jgi:hypothetical protein
MGGQHEINMKPDYRKFLEAKIKLAEMWGFDVPESDVHPYLKPHQRVAVQWLVKGGRRACFAAFGLGKTLIQLEAVRLTREQCGGYGLIVVPLGVRQEFKRDAEKIGLKTKFIRRFSEVEGEDTIYLTNYETIRDGKMDPSLFSVASLDEASVLRGFGGTKTFREFMRLFTGDAGPCRARNEASRVKHRFVATATPSPNDYIELLSYCAFLGIMDVSQAKTRFFKRDSSNADVLTIHQHKEKEFWLWVSSWALFIQRPSDLGFSDDGYSMPEMHVNWHEVLTDHSNAGHEKNGQAKLLRDAAIGVQDAASEKRNSLPNRMAKLMELREIDPDRHRLIWHDTEAERRAVERACKGVVTVYGQQDMEEREKAIIDFSDGAFQELATKPVIAGSGCNFQRHCSWAIFLGIGFKFNDFIQAIHRIQRFLQTEQVRIDIIYTEAEREVRRKLENKWTAHNRMVNKMTDIMKEYGLSQAAMAHTLTRKIGIERIEVTGDGFKIINNDNVTEMGGMADNSLGLIMTSIPFSTQYEYSPNYADFGHSDGNEEFFGQMDFLTPEMFRCLKPGRICAIHVKDRIVPGGMTGLGFQTVYPFHMHCIQHYTKHGFGYMGMKTIVTDVVRENNQTYRLGWTEQCKDGTKMGVGMPEYLLLFRKPQTSTEKSYADSPVVKNQGLGGVCQDCRAEYSKPKRGHKLEETCECGGAIIQTKEDEMLNKSVYSRAKWQIDAHGFTRSSGNRLLNPEELVKLSHKQVFRMFRKHSVNQVYDFQHHVKVGEDLDEVGMLPVTFMLLQPQSWHSDVWTDITRMLTLNGAQSSKGKEMHLCPMQFDLADRVIDQFSNPGDVVFDPFGGLMTVPYRAILKKRFGMGIELSAPYFCDGAAYCKAASEEMNMPSLFDIDKFTNGCEVEMLPEDLQ